MFLSLDFELFIICMYFGTNYRVSNLKLNAFFGAASGLFCTVISICHRYCILWCFFCSFFLLLLKLLVTLGPSYQDEMDVYEGLHEATFGEYHILLKIESSYI